MAAAHALFQEASLKITALDRARAEVAVVEVATEKALAIARHQNEGSFIATAAAKRASSNAAKRVAIRSSNAEHGTQAFSKWRRRQRNAIVQFLVSLFGTSWQMEFGNDASPGETGLVGPHDVNSAKPQDVVEVLDSFFKGYQKLFDVIGDPTKSNGRGRNIATMGETLATHAIKNHFDKVVIAVHTECALTEHAYQALINYTSNVFIEGKPRVVCGSGMYNVDVDDDCENDDGHDACCYDFDVAVDDNDHYNYNDHGDDVDGGGGDADDVEDKNNYDGNDYGNDDDDDVDYNDEE